MTLGWKAAHNFVRKEAAAGKSVRWDGWDIVMFRANPAAWMKRDGVFHSGQWGYERRIQPNNFGKWVVDVWR